MAFDADKILDKLPTRTPLWAVGLISLFVAFTVSVSSFYILSKDDFRWFFGRGDRADIAMFEQQDVVLKALTAIVSSNSAQLTELSKTLGFSEHRNILLTDRVVALEKDMQSTKEALIACEQALKNCKVK